MPVIAQATDRGAKGSLIDAWPRTHKRGHMQLLGDSLMRRARRRELACQYRVRGGEGMSGGKARLPPRWFIKTFWRVHRRIVRASRGRKGLVASASG